MRYSGSVMLSKNHVSCTGKSLWINVHPLNCFSVVSKSQGEIHFIGTICLGSAVKRVALWNLRWLEVSYGVCRVKLLPECKCAVLIIKWEEGDLNGTRTAIDSRRKPVNPAIITDQHICVVSHIKLAINAAELDWNKNTWHENVLTMAKKGHYMYCSVDNIQVWLLTYLFSRTMSGSHTVLHGTRITLMS